jgi:cytosine/adenosine deaminase-related metal-dependent hydrolase
MLGLNVQTSSMLLRARWVLPVSLPPIPNGFVRLADNHIAEVGRWGKPDAALPIHDLGEVALLPGLVNAHCHLDYTHMAGCLAPPKYFPDWIKAILALKAQWSYTEYAQSWLAGARMLQRTGTTTVGDIEAVPELLPEAWQSTPLRMLSLLEMTGTRARRPAGEILAEAEGTMDRATATGKTTGLSPHALYSTSPELVSLAARAARRRDCVLCTHVAESHDEFEMFAHARGPFYDWLKRQRDMSDCGARTPVEQLRHLGALSPRFLAVHVNYFTAADAALLAESESSVVHCPRSHTYFQHQRFDLEQLTAAGVNVCLGTDSLASMLKERGKKPQLNLFAEMAELARSHPEVPPETILRMATLNGARALGMAGQVGELAPGALADIIAVPCPSNGDAALETLVHDCPSVTAGMIDGAWQG